MIAATTPRLILRTWEEKDRDLFHESNADPAVMEFFPFLRTRAQSDELFERLRGIIADTGLGFFALADRESDEALGFCGLSRVSGLEPHLPDGAVEIGWRLARRLGPGLRHRGGREAPRIRFRREGLERDRLLRRRRQRALHRRDGADRHDRRAGTRFRHAGDRREPRRASPA